MKRGQMRNNSRWWPKVRARSMHWRHGVAAAMLVSVLCSVAIAQNGISMDGIPQYRPERQVGGTIRIWGHGAWGRDFMEQLVQRWEADFRTYQPQVRFETDLLGTATAMGALYTGTGDIAILGREVRPSELDAFQRVMGHPALAVDVVAGSFNVQNKDFALGVFVNKANPLRGLTMEQLASVFGCGSAGRPQVTTWGDLGLRGNWADKPIHVFGYQIRRGFGVYLDQAVLGGTGRWNCNYREVLKAKDGDGSIRDDGQVIVDTVASDPYAIGYSGMAFSNPGARTIAVARTAAGPYVTPTRESVYARTYPLYRVLTSFVDRKPGEPLDPKMREFLLYILSRQGQQAVVKTGDYLPLNASVVRQERRKLQ